MSQRGQYVSNDSNMSSTRDKIIAALDAAEASYRKLAALPLEALTAPRSSPPHRLEELDKKMTARNAD